MTATAETILDVEINSDYLIGSGPLRVQVTETGLATLADVELEPTHIPFSAIEFWSMTEEEAWFKLRNNKELTFSASPETLHELRVQLNRAHLLWNVRNMSDKRRKEMDLRSCPACDALFLTERRFADCTSCCRDCHILIGPDGRSRSHKDGYRYAFCGDADFALVGHSEMPWPCSSIFVPAESFLAQMTPIFQKLLSQVLWFLIAMLLTAGLYWATQQGWVEGKIWSAAIYGSMALAFFSMVMAGYYWSGLMIAKAVKVTLRPPPWEKLRRYLLAGRFSQAEELWKDLREQDHPGLLVNWALAHYHHGDPALGREYLEQARQSCPNHPALEALSECFASFSCRSTDEKEKPPATTMGAGA